MNHTVPLNPKSRELTTLRNIQRLLKVTKTKRHKDTKTPWRILTTREAFKRTRKGRPANRKGTEAHLEAPPKETKTHEGPRSLLGGQRNRRAETPAWKHVLAVLSLAGSISWVTYGSSGSLGRGEGWANTLRGSRGSSAANYWGKRWVEEGAWVGVFAGVCVEEGPSPPA